MKNLAISALLTLTLVTSGAAAPTGRIFGSLTDPSGAVIGSATVVALEEQTGRQQSTTSDAVGGYLFVNLPVGTYTISANSPGFKTFRQSGVVLLVDQQVRLDIKMNVGEVSETVSVDAAPIQVDTRTGTITEVVTEKQIVELPLNGRNVQQLVALQAGVQPTPRAFFYNAAVPQSVNFFSVSGTPGNSTNYILDGADHNDHWTNVAMATPNPDALQEFSVQTNNFTADYGSKSGGVVNMVIKSGNNKFHGSAFEFLRNYALNARNFFATVPPTNDGLKRNQYGGTFGGPVFKDKTFFFVSYQGTKLRQRPSSLITFVPTASQRAGDLSGLAPARDPLTGQPFPNNQIPRDRLDPTMQKFLERLVPLPNGPNGQLTYGMRVLRNVNEVIGRVDHSLGAKDKLFGSYYHQVDDGPSTGDPNNVMSLNFGVKFPTRKLSIGETHVFSPTLFNEFRFALGRTQTIQISAANIANNFNWQDIGMQIPKLNDKPAMLYFASPFFSFFTGTEIDMIRRSYQFNDNVSWIRGRHELKFGADVIRNYWYDKEDWIVDGRHSFSQTRTGSPYGDLMLGLPAQYEQLNPALNEANRTLWMFYAQDTFKVNRKLTFTFGARYEPYFNWRSTLGEQAIFVPGQQSKIYPNLPPGLLTLGDAGVPKNGFDNDWKRLGPRLSAAFDPFGDGKTSIRGGYGIFNEVLSTVAFSNSSTSQPFTTAVLLIDPFSFTDPYRGQVNPFPAPIPATNTQPLARPLAPVYSFLTDYSPPQIHQWNLTLERQLQGQMVARAAYVGSHGSGVHRNRDLNPGRYIPGNDASGNPLSTTGNVNSRRPYRDYQSIYSSEDSGRSILHSMQLTLERRFVRGLAFKANYTLQKSLDDAPQTAGAQHQNPVRNPLGDPDMYGPSDFDRTHRFVSNFVWQMPTPFKSQPAARYILGGWELTGIVTLQGGSPFTVSSGGSPSLAGSRSPAYADVLPDCDINARPSGKEPRLQWFNTTCFKNAATGTFGNLGRNRLRGPAFETLDLGLYRNFKINEGMNIQFRTEFFNVLNHTNFGQPNAGLGSVATFGTILSTSGGGGLYSEGTSADPRIIQFALKFTF